MPSYTEYMTEPSTARRAPSRRIWATCPWSEIVASGEGHAFYDDFTGFDAIVITGRNANYAFDGDAGVLLAQTALTDNGHIFMDDLDTDNDAGFLVHGLFAPFARFGASDEVWFECRYKRLTVGDDDGGLFLGFNEMTVEPVSGTTLTDNDSILDASEDFIGWRILAADGDALEPIYQEGAQTIQAVGQGTTNAVGSGTDRAIVADTFIKLGLHFRGGVRGQGRIEYFVNGGLHAYYDIESGDNWPDTNHLAMGWYESANSADDFVRTMDWWRVACWHHDD
jgi:hypothetical protein